MSMITPEGHPRAAHGSQPSRASGPSERVGAQAELAAAGLLVVDDEENVLKLIQQLMQADVKVFTARSAEEAFAVLKREKIGVVITDQRMPGMTGVELLAEVMRTRPETIRIILTAYTDTEALIEAINTGQVYQFITKPWDNHEFRTVIRAALGTYHLRASNSALLAENARLITELTQRNASLQAENRTLRREVQGGYRVENMVGTSASMREAFRIVEKAVASNNTVLIQGETGTGKELIARAIHFSGARTGKSFVTQNCAGIPDTLLESELFGHVKGAFTGAIRDRRGLFEEAHQGTILLDEIGDMPLAMQVKLLRVLEDGEVRPVGGSRSVRTDVRVIAATNKDLRKEVESGRFRQDLFYRLNVFPIHLPTLRERDGDIPLLVTHFIARCRERAGKSVPGITPGAMALLEAYRFPGNVRELEHEITRAVALADDGEMIDAPLLSPEVRGQDGVGLSDSTNGPLPRRVAEFERQVIVRALRENRENRTHTAHKLGISVRALQKKILRYKIRGES